MAADDDKPDVTQFVQEFIQLHDAGELVSLDATLIAQLQWGMVSSSGCPRRE